MIVPRGGFLLPSSRVLGEMVLDEIDTCIRVLVFEVLAFEVLVFEVLAFEVLVFEVLFFEVLALTLFRNSALASKVGLSEKIYILVKMIGFCSRTP